MKRKILFVIPSLAGGGAEKVLITLLKRLDRSLFEPSLVVFDDRNDYRGDMPKDIQVISFQNVQKAGMIGHMRLVISLAALMRRDRPEVVCSFMEYANHLCSLAKWLSMRSSSLFYTQHNMMSNNYKPGRLRSRTVVLWIMRYVLYPTTRKVVCVSRGVMEDYITRWGLPREKAVVIYNPIEIDKIQLMAQMDLDHPWFKGNSSVIIACGRLVPQKNYPLLLRSLSMALKHHPELKLVVLGEGELRNELILLAEELGIANSVNFLGFVPNPYQYMIRSKCLVLSSDWEGFGNVLVEAMACGIPVIATRCPSGPEEIITHGINGILVSMKNANELSEALIRMVTTRGLGAAYALAGRARALDFDAEKITRQYAGLFCSTATL